MRNPVKNDYITAKRLDKATTWAIALSSTFIIISCLQLKFEHLNIQRISEIVAFVFGSISWVLSLVCSQYILNADSNRKKMSIDNAFNMTYGEERSQNYYTNDNIKNGLPRFAVNCFECCFFTYNIAKRMLWKERRNSVAVIAICLIALVLGNVDTLLVIGNISIVTTIIQSWVRLEVLSHRSKHILDSFRELYSIKEAKKNTRESKMLLLTHEYETLISWAGVLLDEKIYEKNNKQLSEEWDKIKAEYGI